MKMIVFVFLQAVCLTGFSQSLSLKSLGQTFRNANLAVSWNAPANSLPNTVWVYHLLPRKLPASAVSNLASDCGFTEKDIKLSNGDAVIYKNADAFPSKQLGFVSSRGSIYYVSASHYGPTNLAEDVPPMSRVKELTTNFLVKLGVDLSEIEKNSHGDPNFHFWQPIKEYFRGDEIITNIEFRAVNFRRSIDGAAFLSIGTGGDGEVYFGPHGEVVHIDLSWRTLKRYKRYPAATPESITKWIREGKAVQCGFSADSGSIDWATVKSLTINKAEPCYYAGDRNSPSDWLMPLVSLWATVDTGHGNVGLEIDCPVIEGAGT